jgi:hypothetical protein
VLKRRVCSTDLLSWRYMRNDYVDITLVIDKSGSMQSLTNDTIGGVNRLLEDQRRVPGKAHLTIIQFDYKPNFTHSALVQNVPNLTTESYKPAGGTALIDAMAQGIIATGNRLRNMPEHERPAKVLFITITDGQENSSKEFTSAQLKQMITEQSTKYAWEFSYLGANVDAFTEAAKYGISLSNVSNYGANSKGIGSTYSIVSEKLEGLRSRTRSGLSANMSFNTNELEKLNDTISESK